MCNVKYVINFNNGVSSATSSRFATGMNGDEDLGQDIIMKGEKFHYRKNDFALLDDNVSVSALKNLVTDKPSQITMKLRGDVFETGYQGSGNDGKDYERVIPTHFSADSDDLFMRSMIGNYAVEKPVKGSPTGTFAIDKKAARAAAAEVLQTHKGLSGADVENYLDTYFDKAWNHFDVNRTGSIEKIRMPQLMRFLASEQRMQLGE